MAWTAWLRTDAEGEWVPLLTGSDERRLIADCNHARRRGDWMILPDGADPNHPSAAPPAGGKHYRNGATASEPAAVVRGQFGRRV